MLIMAKVAVSLASNKKNEFAIRRILGAIANLRKATISFKSTGPHRITLPPQDGFFPKIQHLGIFLISIQKIQV